MLHAPFVLSIFNMSINVRERSWTKTTYSLNWTVKIFEGVWLVYVHCDESEVQASGWCWWSVEQSATFTWIHQLSDQPISGKEHHPYRDNVYTYAKVLRGFIENQHLLQWKRQRENSYSLETEKFVQNITYPEKTPQLLKC